MSWACGHGTEMLLIEKKKLTWLFRDIFRYNSPKKCPTILYAVNLWLKPVSATGASSHRPVIIPTVHTQDSIYKPQDLKLK